jgi:hypothetical protein
MQRLRLNEYERRDGARRAGVEELQDLLKKTKAASKLELVKARGDIGASLRKAGMLKQMRGSSCRELVRRGQMKVAVRMLSSKDEEEPTIPEEGGALNGTRRDVVKRILENMLRKRKGAVATENAKRFLEGLRIIGGETVYNYVSDNLGMHDERTARKETTKARGDRVPFVHGLAETSFILAAQVYKSVKTSRPHLKHVFVPVTLAEDETGVNQRWSHDIATGELIGGCGALCAKKCGTIKHCRYLQCGDQHACDDDPTKTGMITGESEAAYQTLVDFVENNRLGTHLRVVIVNPLDKRFPRLPVLMAATCNTFTYADYIKPQWVEMRTLYAKHLEPIIGPLVGHGSDGDSRRRLAMLLESALRALLHLP